MKTFLRADVDAAGVSLLKDMPESDAVIVLREAAAGTEATLTEAIKAAHAAEVAAAPERKLSVPAVLAADGEADGWTAGVLEAAQLAVSSGRLPRLTEALPELHKKYVGQATVAQQRLTTLESEVDAASQALDEAMTRCGLEAAQFQSVAALRRRLRPWAWVERLALGIDAGTLFVAVAKFFGAFDAAMSGLTLDVWIQAVLITCSGVIASFGSAWGGAWLLRRVGPDHSGAVRLAIAGLVTAITTFAIALGLLRWSSSVEGTAFGTGVEALGSASMAVILGLASLAVVGTVMATRFTLTELHRDLAAAEHREEMQQRSIGELAKKLADKQDELAKTKTVAARPAELEAGFEGSAKLAVKRLRQDEAALRDRLAKALGAFRHVTKLSTPVREALVTYLYSLYRVEKRAKGNGVGATAAGLLVACLFGLEGCKAGRAEHLVVGCDPTGVSAADVCTTRLVQESFSSWALGGAPPQSSFEVVIAGGGLSETIVAGPFRVPATTRGKRTDWTRQTLAELGELPIRPEQPEDNKVNRSDLLAVLFVASRDAESWAENEPANLVLGSDGWFISARFNAERRVPSVGEVVATLRKEGTSPSLRRFSSIVLCGLHHRDHTPAAVASRDRFWREFIPALGGPTPRIHPICRGLFQPVPPALLGVTTAQR